MDMNASNRQFFSLTKSQKLILSMDQYAGNSVSSITAQVILKNENNPEKIKAAVNRVIAGASTLRTIIIKKNDEYFQYFSDYVYEEVQVYSFDTIGERRLYPAAGEVLDTAH
ncbi:MAG TPA: hypothetical protein PLS20_05740 [Ruminococcus flavefaciens]|nr:hypothetical protein [Ruminococcus flavefaciens]